MPRDKNSRLKDPELYEKLRDEGNSKEKSARIANAAGQRGRSTVGKRGGASEAYEEWTVPDLKKRAKELGITGYSGKRKSELITLLRNHRHRRTTDGRSTFRGGRDRSVSARHAAPGPS